MKKLDFSKKVVIATYISVILFTVACVVYQYFTKDSMSEVLIGAFYGFCIGELGYVTAIKRKRIATKVAESCEENG